MTRKLILGCWYLFPVSPTESLFIDRRYWRMEAKQPIWLERSDLFWKILIKGTNRSSNFVSRPRDASANELFMISEYRFVAELKCEGQTQKAV
jgi:hypothetical protein